MCAVELPDLNSTVAARARQRVKRVSREAKGLNCNAALIGVDTQEPLPDVGDRSERIPRKVQVSLTPGLSGQNHSFRRDERSQQSNVGLYVPRHPDV
jgi:hypothetical protein